MDQRPLDQLPPLDFPIPTEVFAQFKPTVQEYTMMVDEYFQKNNIPRPTRESIKNAERSESPILVQ